MHRNENVTSRHGRVGLPTLVSVAAAALALTASLVVLRLQAGEDSAAGKSAAERAAAVKSDSVVKVTAAADRPDSTGKQRVAVTLTIDDGWHVYANPAGGPDYEGSQTTVSVQTPANTPTQVDYPSGKLAQDGNYRIYDGKTAIPAVVQRAAGDVGPADARGLLRGLLSQGQGQVPAADDRDGYGALSAAELGVRLHHRNDGAAAVPSGPVVGRATKSTVNRSPARTSTRLVRSTTLPFSVQRARTS